ncbi:MAG: hypothetical protein ABIV63_14530 [Caldimonas sp.]
MPATDHAPLSRLPTPAARRTMPQRNAAAETRRLAGSAQILRSTRVPAQLSLFDRLHIER